MVNHSQQALSATKPISIRGLYEEHAGMLLGYLFEIVKDRKLAEEYLAKIFTDIARQFHEADWSGNNTWCRLQRLAKNELAQFNDTIQDCEDHTTSGFLMQNSHNKYLDQMTDEQKQLFCSVYYHRKTTVQLSKELNKPEDLIRKLLKEAFAIIRKSCEN